MSMTVEFHGEQFSGCDDIGTGQFFSFVKFGDSGGLTFCEPSWRKRSVKSYCCSWLSKDYSKTTKILELLQLLD